MFQCCIWLIIKMSSPPIGLDHCAMGGQADIIHFLTLNISKTTQKMKNPKTSEIFILFLFKFSKKNSKKFGKFFLAFF